MGETQTLLIPKGFFRIAESEMISGKTGAYVNKERGMLLFIIDDSTIVGPFPISKLECFQHVLRDVWEMKGRYHGI